MIKRSVIIINLIFISILANAQKEQSLMIYMASYNKINWKVVCSHTCSNERNEQIIINTELEEDNTLGFSASKKITYPSGCNISLKVFLGNEERPTSVFTFSDIENKSELKIVGGLNYVDENTRTPYVEYTLLQKGNIKFH